MKVLKENVSRLADDLTKNVFFCTTHYNNAPLAEQWVASAWKHTMSLDKKVDNFFGLQATSGV